MLLKNDYFFENTGQLVGNYTPALLVHYNQKNLQKLFIENSKLDNSVYLQETHSTEKLNNSMFLQPTLDIQSLKKKYSFVNYVEVEAFLWKNHHLINFLKILAYKIENFFTNIANVSIKYYDFPETGKILYVVVSMNESPENCVEILSKFDNEWWLDNMEEGIEVTVRSI